MITINAKDQTIIIDGEKINWIGEVDFSQIFERLQVTIQNCLITGDEND